MRIERRRFTAGSDPGDPAGVDQGRVDPVVFQLGVQGGATDLQSGGGLFDIAVDLLEGRQQDFAFRFLELAGEVGGGLGIGRNGVPDPGR